MIHIKKISRAYCKSRNLNILCDAYSSILLFIGVLLTSSVCCSKIETQIKLLNEDFTVPNPGYDYASPFLSSNAELSTAPHYILKKNHMKRISYESIHRILRDENEPMIYRTNDLRYFHKRSIDVKHGVSKRSIDVEHLHGKSLNFTNRNLKTFPPEAVGFSHRLQDITSIFLYNNSLKSFPIFSLPSLTFLDLSQNNFTCLELPAKNTQLRVLNLNQNRMISFKTIPTNCTSFNNNIRELYLKDNAIRGIGKLNLSLFEKLEVLDLSCNQLENQGKAFFSTNMQSLRYLNLAHNQLKNVRREAFYNLFNINTLILSYNEITEVDYESFLALPNLQYLDLSHNNLKGDSIKALQGIPDLEGLSIAHNVELGDSMQEFVASWSLKELDVSGTGLCKIPAALAQSVRTLKLADNWLEIISCGDLDSYPLLQYLDLSASHIDEIEEDALGRLEILETLFLDHNNLKKIPVSLPTRLENLFLNDNQIMDIPVQSFQGLHNLKTLDMSSNKLIYLPDLPLPKLLTLNLQSSGINGLHQGIVKTSPNLRDLYLENNPIKCADLLRVAEWASPCRNDRLIVDQINMKSSYVQMHDYFQRFQCEEIDRDKCNSCVKEVEQRELLRQSTCVERKGSANGTVSTASKTLIQVKKVRLIQAITVIAKNFIESTSTQKPINYADRDKPRGKRNQSRSSSASLSEGLKKNINAHGEIISLVKNQQIKPTNGSLAVSSIRRLLRMKTGQNYDETSGGSNWHHTSSLLRQENTDKNHKRLQKQLDNVTNIRISNNEETFTVAKSNISKTVAFEYQTLAATTTERMIKWQTPIERPTNVVLSEQKQVMQHSKDRHLIGTPLITHKGHVIVSETPIAIGTSNQKEENTLYFAPHHGDSHTAVTALNFNKFDSIGSTDFFYHYPEHQISNENANIEGRTSNINENGRLRKLLINHYQVIKQSNDQNETQSEIVKQKFNEVTTLTTNRDFENAVPLIQNNIKMASSSKVISNLKHRHNSYRLSSPAYVKKSGLNNTPLHKVEISGETKTESSSTSHDGLVNKPLLKNEDYLLTLHANAESNTSQESKTNQKNRIAIASTAPANFINLETTLKMEEGTLHYKQQITMKPEHWLDIRKAIRYPGLVLVVGLTLATMLFVGLLQVYRYKYRPLNFLSHTHYGYKHEQTGNQYQKHRQYESQERSLQQNRCHQHYHHNHDQNQYPSIKNSFTNDRRPPPISLKLLHNQKKLFGITGSLPPRNYEVQREKCSPEFATYNSCSSANYRFYQKNGKRIKRQHHPDDENNFCNEMNHSEPWEQDFLPMELLSAPSRTQPLSSSSMSSSLAANISSSRTHFLSSAVSLVGYNEHQQIEKIGTELGV